MDILFLHVPKFNNYYPPLGRFININYLPRGIFAMADYCTRSGFTTGILHAGVERIKERRSAIREILPRDDVAIFALDLYWHYQSYAVIEAAREIKALRPDSFVLLGGFTASYFATEIMQQFPFVDGIITGFGELPLVELLQTKKSARDLSSVANLVWRKDNDIVVNKSRYLFDQALYDSLIFSHLSLLKNHQVYIRNFGFPLAYGLDYSEEENRKYLNMGTPFFPLDTGRGCPVVCSYCGGNSGTLQRIAGAHILQFRSIDSVLRDIRQARDYGYRTMSLCFDPFPRKFDYYRELFKGIRQEKIEVNFYFESWAIPSQEFIKDFARTFPSKESYIAISPDSGGENIRKKNKGYSYTNADMFEFLENSEKKEISVDVFFTIGLPFERYEDTMRTKQVQREIIARFSNIRRLMTWSIQIEPGSRQFENPSRYGIITDRRNFMDFYHVHGGNRADTYSGLGYKLKEYFLDKRDNCTIHEFERRLMQIKCEHFCFLNEDPRLYASPEKGRKECLRRRQVIAERRNETIPEDEYPFGRLIGR